MREILTVKKLFFLVSIASVKRSLKEQAITMFKSFKWLVENNLK